MLWHIPLAAALATAAAGQSPTAVKKQPPHAHEKLHLQDLAFAPILQSLLPRLAPLEPDAALLPVNAHEPEAVDESSHLGDTMGFSLEKRTSCPADMTSCDAIGFPNKCCASGTYCTAVTDPSVGQVACCPDGATCGGGVGKCPAGAVSCAADLGGGCCISGYVCQGVGCVPGGGSATAVPPVGVTYGSPIPQTITTTKTTIVAGVASTVVVTMTVTRTATPPASTETQTKTETKVVTESAPTGSSGSSSATGVPPWRPTAASSTHTAKSTVSPSSSHTSGSTVASDTPASTQTGCPTGFYGCSATHGGGCCRTERDCGVLSCPLPSSTTILSHGVTVVVPASDVPATATATSECAGGWFLCGEEAGPVAGCCPSGFECGTASCFTVRASSTSKVQKDAPAKNQAGAYNLRLQGQVMGLVLGGLFLAVWL